MEFCVLGSGSSGNSTLIKTEKLKILVDCGISVNAINSQNEIDLTSIDLILITHHHSDHVKYLIRILKLSNAYLYITQDAYNSLSSEVQAKLLNHKVFLITPDSAYTFQDITIYTLKLNHDAINTLGFIIKDKQSSLGIFTDTGIFPSKYLNVLKTLDAIIIEANHNITMQLNSYRHTSLINRILSPKGHLSNESCYEVLAQIINTNLKVIILAHVSKDCNSLFHLQEEIINKLSSYNGLIEIASQDKPTKVYFI